MSFLLTTALRTNAKRVAFLAFSRYGVVYNSLNEERSDEYRDTGTGTSI
jgi:hypothetical protein